MYKWIEATDEFYKNSNFTNMCRDCESFGKEMSEVVGIIIPKLYTDYNDIFNPGNRKQNKHCHIVAPNKIELCEKIAHSIHGIDFEQIDDSTFKWWQIGFTAGVRIIGIYDSYQHDFFPMFIDRHHLLHPSDSYNQQDHGKYSYNPGRIK